MSSTSSVSVADGGSGSVSLSDIDVGCGFPGRFQASDWKISDVVKILICRVVDEMVCGSEVVIPGYV